MENAKVLKEIDDCTVTELHSLDIDKKGTSFSYEHSLELLVYITWTDIISSTIQAIRKESDFNSPKKSAAKTQKKDLPDTLKFVIKLADSRMDLSYFFTFQADRNYSLHCVR